MRTKYQNLIISRLVLQLSLPIEAIKIEDVGAEPTACAPTTSKWSTMLLPTKVRLILVVWYYVI